MTTTANEALVGRLRGRRQIADGESADRLGSGNAGAMGAPLAQRARQHFSGLLPGTNGPD